MDGKLYVFSGTNLVPDKNGTGLIREFLTDAWRYDSTSGWTQLADMPEGRVAAPSPAIPVGMAHLVVMGGDTGEHFFQQAELKDDHPGFTGKLLSYHTITDTWIAAGSWPIDHGPDPASNPAAGIWSTVTVPTVEWNNLWVIPSGEIRPGVRSPRVMSLEQASDKKDVGMANLVTLVLYLGAMLGIGFFFARREKSTDRFFRGGQTLPWWAVGLSIYATMLSSITFMAIPAKAYTSDWSYFFANVAIVVIAPVVISLYLPFYRRLDVTSAYEYLEKRFNLAVRLFGSASFILFQIGRMAIVLYLPAMALSAVSSLDVYTCILLMAILCIVYTMIGGIEAVIWTDVVQTFVLLGGAILSFILIMFRTENGFSGFLEVGQLHHKFFEDTVWFSPDIAVASVVVIFVGSLFNNLVSYTAGQDVVQRYMTTSSQEKAVRSIWTNALLALPGTVIFFGLGTAFFVFYKSHPDKLSMTIANDQILPLFVVRELPVGIAGLVIAGIMAASQSTLSSSLNSVSAAWMTDFHKRLWPGGSDHRHLRLAQTCVLITGTFAAGVACIMASMSIKSLFDAFISVIGMTGGALAGFFALGIFTRTTHGVGALIGAITSIIVLYFVKTYTDINFFLYGAVGICTCFVVGYLASLVIPAKRKPLNGLTLRD
jgi:SSS family transporter